MATKEEVELFLNTSRLNDKLHIKDLNPDQLLIILEDLTLVKTGEFLISKIENGGKANIVFNYFKRSCTAYFQIVIDFWNKTIILINIDD